MEIQNPYIDTYLYTTVPLFPHQFNNDIYMYLKNNAKENLEGKCYKNYKLVDKIYEVTEKDDGYIVPESPIGLVKFNCKLSVRLCVPVENNFIVGEIDRMSRALITVINGPIVVACTPDRINKQNFILDNLKGKYFHIKNKKETPLEKGIRVKVFLEKVSYSNGDQIIKCIGILKDVASNSESSQYDKQKRKPELSADSDSD